MNMKRKKFEQLRYSNRNIHQCFWKRIKPPWVLYAKGNPSLLTKDRLLAVVGSRKATTLW